MGKKILITGAAGTGCSTLAQMLAIHLQSEWFDVDDFYWLSVIPRFTVKRPEKERIELIRSTLEQSEAWTLSGSIMNWGDFIIPKLDLAVFLLVDTEERLMRIKHRELQRFGQEVLSPGGSRYKIYCNFLAWAEAYNDGCLPGRSLQKHETWLSNLPCPVLRIQGSESNEIRMQAILNSIQRQELKSSL